MSKQRFDISRRSLLNAAALGASAMVLPSLRPKRAWAADPTRLVIFTTGQQFMKDQLEILPSGGSFADAPNSTFTGLFAGLEAHKQHVSLVDGMSIYTALKTGSNAHGGSKSNLLTAAGPYPDSQSDKEGPSVDQIIARALTNPGPVSSVEAGVAGFAGGFVSLGKNQNAPIIEDPNKLFARLFDGIDLTGMISPSVDALFRAAKGDALDVAMGHYKTLASKVSGEDKTRLEGQLDNLAQYRKRFAGSQSVSCDSVAAAASPAEIIAKTIEYGRIIADAMACGVTRVATIQMRELSPTSFGAAGSLHQDLAHNDGNPNGAGANGLRKYLQANAKAFAGVVNHFASRNLLESTLIVWMPEHGVDLKTAVGPHEMNNLAAIMVGNMNGHFKVGARITLPQRTPQSLVGYAPRVVGKPHSHFLVSLARGMGLDVNQIGLGSHGGQNLTGAMAEIET